MGLWMTLESCMLDLEGSGLTYEFRVCSNGADKIADDDARTKHWVEKHGNLGEFSHIVEPTAPPCARQMLTENANGRFLFFFDNHCMVVPGYFRRGIESMEKYGINYLHSSTRFFSGEGTDYSYHLCLARDFWTEYPYRTPHNADNPYRVAVAGHGGFAVRATTWKEIGGYFQGFEGYGGEETSTDLKAWCLGTEVWIDPKMVHLHWSGQRAYDRHFTDDYYRNSFMAAYIVGGERWLHTVFKGQAKCTRFVNKTKPTVPLFDLLVQAQERATRYAKWVDSKRLTTLDTLLKRFVQEDIPH